MGHDHSEHEHSSGPRAFNLVLIGFIGIAAFFLITEHRAHLYGFLPFAFLLACSLLHMFMHGKHGGHAHDAPDVTRGGASHEHDAKKENTP